MGIKTLNFCKQTRKQLHWPILVAADLRRPAAVEQLATLGRQLDIPVLRDSTSVSALAQGALAEARRTGATVVIVDTGGPPPPPGPPRGPGGCPTPGRAGMRGPPPSPPPGPGPFPPLPSQRGTAPLGAAP